MNHSQRLTPRALTGAATLLLLTRLASAAPMVLSGANEVPPVQTAASGSASIMVAEDGSVSGSIKTTGIAGSAAHLHLGAPGKNGPVAIALSKGGEGEWLVPAGAKLDAEQLKACKAGECYVNVHSAEHKGGEIRAQLAP